MSHSHSISNLDANLLESIKSIILSAQKSTLQKVNQDLIGAYWQIGKENVLK